MENNPDKALLRNNPIFVIFIACLLAAVMILISVFSYARSDTRKTIEQIQANNHLIQQQDSTTLTKNGDVNAESVNEIEKSITKDIQSHDDEADFSPDELTDSALGL